jgi:AraC-like DNA-binding protein
MPLSTVLTFTDPDRYTASLQRTNAEMMTLGGGRFEAKLVRISLGRLQLQRLSDNLPRTSFSADVGGYATISFRTTPGPALHRSGVELLLSNIIRCGNRESYFQKSEGLACFGTMSLPIADLVSIGAEVVGCNLAPPQVGVSITPSHLALTKLKHLHEAAGHLAEHAPSVITHPEAAHGLEQAMIEAMVACLGVRETDDEDRSALRQHSLIMRRFRRVMEENLDKAVFITELCKEVGVTERTLRVCCQEQLGVGPKRYLLLRRMQLARRALQSSDRGTTSVTEVATRYGFWEFGRFAGEYKSAFGELPSATLGHRLRFDSSAAG